MTHVLTDPIWLFQAISAVFYVVLGAWVLTLTPRRRQTVLLGAFAIAFGLVFLVFDVSGLLDYFPDSGLHVTYLISIPFSIGSAVALIGLVWSVPEPLGNRRLLTLALALGFGLGLAQVTALQLCTEAPVASLWSFVTAIAIQFGAIYAAALLLALRARPKDTQARPAPLQLALLGVAIATYDAFGAGSAIVEAAGSYAAGGITSLALDGLFLFPWFLFAGLWAWNMVQAGDGEGVRTHRTAMLGILAVLLAGALYEASFPDLAAANLLGVGVMRTLGVGLLAYGILRHDLAGLDAKVEYGLSKTTVAGVFVAVFFAASEAAQVLFADFAGNELIGVAAAALLVFAIAPLQRLADRFAAKAVPGGAEWGTQNAEASYRRAVETALADGEITEDEERYLAELVDDLEISSARAYELRRELEDQAEGGEAT